MRTLAAELRLIRPCTADRGASWARAARLALAVAGASLASFACIAAPLRDERPLAAGQVLHLRIEAGDVVVRGGDAGRAVVEAELQPGQRLVWRETADRLVLVIDDRERLTPRVAAVRLLVPADASLALNLGDAALDLEGVSGERLVVCGGRGNVRLASSAAQVDVDTGAGRIDARVDGGRLRANSIAGAQRLDVSGSDALTAATVSGAVDLRLAMGAPVRVSSVSGRVDVSVDDTDGLDARIDTLGGGIRLRVRSGEPFSLALAQARGRVDVPDAIERRPDGTLRSGEGGGTIRLASFSGAIDIDVPQTSNRDEVGADPDPEPDP